MRYIAARLIQSAVLFWIVTVITFVVIRQAPGGPAILADPNLTKDQMSTLGTTLGLADPIYVQYIRWVGHLASGDLGISFNEGVPVSELIAERLPNTLLLGAVALCVALVVGLGLGIVSAVKRNGWIDMVASTFGVFNLCVPAFWLAIVLILVFAVELQWLPVGGMPRPEHWSLVELARCLIMPAWVAAGFLMANIMRYTRSSFLEVHDQLYITAARAMGVRERTILLRLALKNAMLPVVTVIGLGIPQLFGGAAITETVFAWPGIGSLGIAAARNGDFPLIMGITLIVSGIVIVANLLTDLSYLVLDPRVRLR